MAMQVSSYAKQQQDLELVGYYHANERFNDTDLGMHLAGETCASMETMLIDQARISSTLLIWNAD